MPLPTFHTKLRAAASGRVMLDYHCLPFSRAQKAHGHQHDNVPDMLSFLTRADALHITPPHVIFPTFHTDIATPGRGLDSADRRAPRRQYHALASAAHHSHAQDARISGARAPLRAPSVTAVGAAAEPTHEILPVARSRQYNGCFLPMDDARLSP